jgi:hypothetical protein
LVFGKPSGVAHRRSLWRLAPLDDVERIGRFLADGPAERTHLSVTYKLAKMEFCFSTWNQRKAEGAPKSHLRTIVGERIDKRTDDYPSEPPLFSWRHVCYRLGHVRSHGDRQGNIIQYSD